ncbi:pyruvate formate lyase activating enzyme [Spiroplasma sp. NBRC 100390]|uniref:pyruvate formate-lyase-activating protein n=1 Tax=unclassified Spiroplasma TaxID=2637901 RepID=UPI0008927E97|nr:MULTISPECIES: pyruvate formate-lyase-activating protein [unclassified Spiroplasma]AOX43747.1 pyruvate formate lyase activating enzyme [Spiroplasma sp. TU-14]APE13217.1 pyruvate formate lyase activating enzyme [Spiroplasma sp. NBRC 100390]
MSQVIGYYSSYESFGAVDGPGLRLVYFLQGCPLRCKYCHNPETQVVNKEKPITVAEIIDHYEKSKEFYRQGGITISGGEPLMQIDFIIALFTELKKRGIHTCVDTSVVTFSENPLLLQKWGELVKVCDLFICDIKEINSARHKELTGLGNENILKGIKWLDEQGANLWIRHVLVPGYTDTKENLTGIGHFIKDLKHMEKFEILPYHNMMVPKYDNMNRKFELPEVVPPTREYCQECLKIINKAMHDA